MAYSPEVGWDGISEGIAGDALVQLQDPVICGVLIAAFVACIAFALIRRMLG